jgi:hypothetical protein
LEEVRKPKPHDMCIVARTTGSKNFVAKVSPTINPLSSTPAKYPTGAIKNKDEKNTPKRSPIAVIIRVNGGAKYLKLIVPGCVRITSRRHLPYSKYCFAKERIVDLGR